jgi:hypothetical protein
MVAVCSVAIAALFVWPSFCLSEQQALCMMYHGLLDETSTLLPEVKPSKLEKTYLPQTIVAFFTGPGDSEVKVIAIEHKLRRVRHSSVCHMP